MEIGPPLGSSILNWGQEDEMRRIFLIIRVADHLKRERATRIMLTFTRLVHERKTTSERRDHKGSTGTYMVHCSAPKEVHDRLLQAIATSLRQGE
jgi:hypothetical protein